MRKAWKNTSTSALRRIQSNTTTTTAFQRSFFSVLSQGNSRPLPSRRPFSSSVSGKGAGGIVADAASAAGSGTNQDSSRPPAMKPLYSTRGDGNNDNKEKEELVHRQHQILLDDAAAESQRIFDRTSLTSALHLALQAASSTSSSSSSIAASPMPPNHHNVMLFEKMKDLEDAADSLLQATKSTIPLAQLLLTQPPQDDRVRSLHRTFLSILGKCVSVLREAADPQPQHQQQQQQTSSSSSTDYQYNPTDNHTMMDSFLYMPSRVPSLLDKTLRLAVRARGDLGLPLHLPLYQGLALSVAQSSLSSLSSSQLSPRHRVNVTAAAATTTTSSTSIASSSSSSYWIAQLGTWAHEDFLHHIKHHDFFAGPLCVLAHRKSYDEVVHLLRAILKNPTTTSKRNHNSKNNSKKKINHKEWSCSLDYLDERTLSQLFRILYDDLKLHVWEPSDEGPTNKTNDDDFHSKTTQQQQQQQHPRSPSIRRTGTYHHHYHQRLPSKATTTGSTTTVADALEEILVLLEPSVWKLFEEEEDEEDEDVLSSKSSSLPPSIPEDEDTSSSFLRDAIDVLVSPRGSNHNVQDDEENNGDDSSSPVSGPHQPLSLQESRELLHALFPEEFPEDVESLEFWEDDEDDHRKRSNRNFLLDETEHHLTSGTWEFLVDMDSDLSVVAITRHPFPDEEDDDDDDEMDDDDDDDDDWSGEIPRTNKWRRLETVPDIIYQIEVVTGQHLQYSKTLQRDLLDRL